MTILPQTDCCTMLGIDPKTLRKWLASAQMQFMAHPTDARLKCLTDEQVQKLATLHGRDLAPTSSLFSVPKPNEAPHPEPSHVFPSLFAPEGDLGERMALLEKQVASLQEQVAQLALQLLQERQLREMERLQTQLALPSQMLLASSPALLENPALSSPDGLAPVVRRLHPAELRARSRVLPLIEYGAQGFYVPVCPQEGVLSLAPDSPDWFDWLASLASFRFVGPTGRFTAYRDTSRGQRTRAWIAHRRIHGQLYRQYLGVTDRLTVASLEQAATLLQSHLTTL